MGDRSVFNPYPRGYSFELGANASEFPNFTAALVAMQSGISDVDIIWDGDSTTAGADGGGVADSISGAYPYRAVAALANYMNFRGYLSSSRTIYGNARTASAAAYTDYDAQTTFTGTWTIAANAAVIGGGFFSAAATATMTVDFGATRDILDLSVDETVAGTFDVKVGGSTVATVNTASGAHQSVTLPGGTTSVDIVWASGTIKLYRVHPRSAATKRVYVSSAGQPSEAANQTSGTANSYNTQRVVAALRPSLYIIDSWINDSTLSTYQTAIQSRITTAKAAGAIDIILFGGNNISGGSTNRQDYMDILSALAIANGCVFFDLATITDWTSYAAASAAGYMDGNVHLSRVGNKYKGIALGVRVTASASTSSTAEVAAIVAQMSVAPSGARQTLMGALITSLKSSGVWDKLDALWLLAAHDAQAGLINWKAPTQIATAVSSPTFTTDRGYAGNGTSSYIDTNFNLQTNALNFTRRSAHIAYWSRTSAITTGNNLGARISSGSQQVLLTGRLTGDVIAFRVNVGTSPATNGTGITDGKGDVVARRASEGAAAVLVNNVSKGTWANASVDPPNLNLYLLTINQNGTPTGFSDQELAAASLGESLTNQNIVDRNTALTTYLTALGAV